jgi:hypothetical protein
MLFAQQRHRKRQRECRKITVHGRATSAVVDDIIMRTWSFFEVEQCNATVVSRKEEDDDEIRSEINARHLQSSATDPCACVARSS